MRRTDRTAALCVIQAAKQLSNVLMNRRTDASNRYINLAEQQPQLLCNLSDLESLTNCTAAATIMCVVYYSIYICVYYVYICVFNLGISLASFRKSPKTSWPLDFEIPLRKQLADKAGSPLGRRVGQLRDSPAQQTIQ